MTDLVERLRVFWCSWTHGGGQILRDPSDRINWQCLKCGRWSTPVSHEDERAVVDAAIDAARAHHGP